MCRGRVNSVRLPVSLRLPDYRDQPLKLPVDLLALDDGGSTHFAAAYRTSPLMRAGRGVVGSQAVLLMLSMGVASARLTEALPTTLRMLRTIQRIASHCVPPTAQPVNIGRSMDPQAPIKGMPSV